MSWCTIESDPGKCFSHIRCHLFDSRDASLFQTILTTFQPHHRLSPSFVGVFTELISKIGVNGVIVEEVYSLDMVPTANPCHGLIFLFEWQKSEQKDTRPVIDPSNLPDVFFARQTVSNACATQAILSILLNRSDVDLSPDLLTFKEFAMAMPADVRGDMIGQQDLIRTVHNSFSHPDPFEIEGPSTGKKGKVSRQMYYI